MSKRAFIIIDLQNDYFPGGRWTLSGIDAAADNASQLLADARRAGDLDVVQADDAHAEATAGR
jgi:nicotinamidase-related amidase